MPGQKLDPYVLMMEPAEDWYCCDASGLLRTPKIRCILGQGEMRPELIVIGGVIPQNTTQVRLTEHHYVIEAFTTY